MALWENSDQDIQDISSDAGGHVDVTNVVYGSGFCETGLQGYIVKIGEYGVAGVSFDVALTVAAWHEWDGSTYNVFYRVFYLWLNRDTNEIETGMSTVYEISNPNNDRQLYPAITAYLGDTVPMKGGISVNLTIDIAYAKYRAIGNPVVEHKRYTCTVTEVDPDLLQPGGVGIENMSLDSTTILPVPNGVAGSCTFPDIAFFGFPDDTQGDTGNVEVETLFAVYEFESDLQDPDDDYYGIIYADFYGEEWNQSRSHFLTIIDKDENVIPGHPRIDAGLDFAYDGINVVTAVWHEWEDDIIDDFDWISSSIDISDFPTIGPLASQTEFPNPVFYWSFYPYVDFDPIEKYFEDALDTYAHFVYTQGQDEDNDYFQVTYTSSEMANQGNESVIYVNANKDAGFAAIAAYAGQGIDDDEADFDIVFISDYEGSDFLVYSQQGELLNEACTSVSVGAFSVEQISNSSNESAWQSPDSMPFLYGPVNAVMDYLSEHACWTHDDTTDEVYGDYEIRE